MVLSWADAAPASATEIEAAQSSPRTCLNLMVMVSGTSPRDAKLLVGDRQRQTRRLFIFNGPFSIAWPVHRGKLRPLPDQSAQGAASIGAFRIGRSDFDPDVDGVAGVAIPLLIVEGHDMRRGGCKGASQHPGEGIIRRVVRP